MEEDEIKNLDLRGVYKLIEIHAEMNSDKKGKSEKRIDETEAYIDGIIF